MRLNPFRALRPAPALAAQVAAVPYDVVNRDEAAALAAGNPHSFLHVGRSDIDLPPDTDPHDDRVYAAAREALERFQRDGTLIREPAPCFYLYRQVMDGRAQTGVVGCVHIDDYERDVIRKHEKTRKDKEDDRTRHVLELGANAEPVFLTYRARPELDRLADPITREEPLYDFTAPDGVRHVVWRIEDTRPWAELFGTVPVAYVADGHHRSASAWRAGRELQCANPGHHGNEEYNWFLAVLFPDDQLRILPYNRVVRDLGGQTPARVLERLAEAGTVRAAGSPEPPRAGSVGVYLDGTWHLWSSIPRGSHRRTRPLPGREPAARAGAGPGARHRGRAHRSAHRLRGRHPRPGGPRAAGGLGRGGDRVLDVPHHPRPAHGRLRRRRGDAPEEHLVRAQAAQRPVGAHAGPATR